VSGTGGLFKSRSIPPSGEGLRKYNDDMLEKVRHAMRSAPRARRPSAAV
jgi:hypothetical protein